MPIRFQEDYNTNARSRGVTRAMAEEVMAAPDVTGIVGDPANSQHSAMYLHLKRHVAETGDVAFGVLVVSGRRDGEYFVMDGWRLYHDIHPQAALASARDALRAFVDRYGVTIQLGREVGKYLEGVTIPARPNGEIPMVSYAEVLPPDAHVSVTLLAQRLESPGRLAVTLGYAINEMPYRLDLKRRGVNIRWE